LYDGTVSLQEVTMRLPSFFTLAALVLLTAFSQIGFAQSDPLIGTWKLNLTKSKYDPGPPPRSSTMHYEPAGQGFRDTVTGVDAQGRPTTSVFMMIYDGKFYPTTGVIGYDASAFTRVDDRTVTYIRTLAGKVVGTGTRVLSRDGKTLTFTGTGTTADGRLYNNVTVFDKQ
jgi:hypothetical protein